MLSSTASKAIIRRAPWTWRAFSVSASRAGQVSVNDTAEGREYTHPKIGDREIVGWGVNGDENYLDRVDYPFPAIRWKSPNAPGVSELRQKELSDWKSLTLEEKKALYRASFCQTFAEFKANDNGWWKQSGGICLLMLSGALWMFFFVKQFIYPKTPESFSEEERLKGLRWDIATRRDPIQGLASKWDYEKDQWK